MAPIPDFSFGLTIAKIAELKADLALLQLRLALKEFNPAEPRWPAGTRVGGRWRREDEAAPGPQPNAVIVDVATREGVYSGRRMSKCRTQLDLDQEICRAVQSINCWNMSDIRFNNCMRNVYIPPLEVGI